MRRHEPCLNTGMFADAAVGNTQDLSQASGYISCMAGIYFRERRCYKCNRHTTQQERSTDYGAIPGKPSHCVLKRLVDFMLPERTK